MKRPVEELELNNDKGRLRLRVEPMEKRDLSQVLVLERRCFSSPWSGRLFREELEHPWAVLELVRMIEGPTDLWETLRGQDGLFPFESDEGSRPPPLRAERGRDRAHRAVSAGQRTTQKDNIKTYGNPHAVHYPLVGYMDYWLVHEELHLLSLAVHPDFRRLGLGVAMVERVLAATRFIAGKRVKLEVRRNNVAAQALYEKLGFVVQGVRHGYYSDTGEDALVMVCEVKAAGDGGGPDRAPSADAEATGD